MQLNPVVEFVSDHLFDLLTKPLEWRLLLLTGLASNLDEKLSSRFFDAEIASLIPGPSRRKCFEL